MERDDTSRFVVQEHHTPDGVHWDLMIEMDNTLRTWRMDCPPNAIGNAPLSLTCIADHPLRFLSYEGPVQNNTGYVQIRDRGGVVIEKASDGLLDICFDGDVLNGYCRLMRNADDSSWTLHLSL